MQNFCLQPKNSPEVAVAWGWDFFWSGKKTAKTVEWSAHDLQLCPPWANPKCRTKTRIRSELLGLSSVLAFELSEIAGEDVIGLYYWPGL